MVQVFTEKVQGIDVAALEAAAVPILCAHRVRTAEISHQREQGGWVLRVTIESLEGRDAPSQGVEAGAGGNDGATEASRGQNDGGINVDPGQNDGATEASRGQNDGGINVDPGQNDGGINVDPGQNDGGIDVGLLAEVSRDLSTALDVVDIIPHRYTLEVSSAGLERPLRDLSDFQRAISQLAKIHLSRPAADGQRVLRGRITQVDATTGVTIVVDGNPVIAPLADVARAHTIYEVPAQPKRNRPTKKQRH